MQSSLERVLSVALIDQLLGLALGGGGDFAEIYVERSRTNSFILEERKIRSAACHVRLGVGIRVLAGQEVGYAYCEDLDTEALRQTARTAASIARSGKTTAAVAMGRQKIPDRYPIAQPLDDIAPKDKIALLMRGDAAAWRYDARVSQVMGSFVDQTRDILIATSEGLLTEDTQSLSRLNLSAVASQGQERRTGFHGGGGRVEFDHFEQFTPEHVGAQAARMATAQLGAKAAPAGPQTVVLSPGWSGILLHEAVGHGLEADFIQKGTSLFANALGQQVASPLCTIIDSGTLMHRRGSLNIDDEGHVAQEKVLIDRGVLKGFMVDRRSARQMGIASTGSGRRQSYQHAPMPRMTNTYMAPGPHDPGEILASVKDGLYCASFGGGQVDIANGNFVFEVREGYRIKDGKLAEPVANATLIGVGPKALKQVSMVGNDLELDPGIGTCGKDGQSVPVGVGLPTIRIDNITVGGTQIA